MKHLRQSESGVMVVIPDYDAKGMLHATKETQLFMREIEDICLRMKYRLMIIANGPDPQSLVSHVEESLKRLLSDGFDEHHLVLPAPETFAKGTVGAAQKGFDQFLASDDMIVVKMDTAEHPASSIPTMVDAIRKEAFESVVGDLDFTDSPFILGERDRIADERIAAICDSIGLPFRLTNAHGYLAHAKQGFEKFYRTANEIHDRASAILNETAKWGYDMSQVLAAALEKRNLLHMDLQPKQDRIRDEDLDYDRKMKKIKAQEIRWEAVARAYMEIKTERGL